LSSIILYLTYYDLTLIQ